MSGRRSSCATALVLATMLLGGGCGVPPKPQALTRLEHFQRLASFVEAREAAAPQARAAAEAQKRAERAWRAGDEPRAKHWSDVGLLRAEEVTVAAETRRLSDQLAAAQAELKQLAQRRVSLAETIDATDEKIMLYEELAIAQISTKEKELELSDFQQGVNAQRGLDQAQLAIKLADTVDAARHAKRIHHLAELALQRGLALLKRGSLPGAAKAASLSKRKAEAAYAVARPIYRQQKRAEEQRQNSEILHRDAAKLPLPEGAKLRTVGQSRQLVLPLTRLFARRATAPRRSALPLLAQVAQLLLKYPDYPVLVNGYTSSRVRRDRRYTLSLERARQVTNYLLTLGLPFKRFAVSGRGNEEPLGRRGSSKNDRVDVILLFQ